MALSVSILNVLLKVVVLSSVALCGALVGRCLKLLARIRLRKSGSSPLVFPTDGTIFKVRSSANRFGSRAFLGIGTVVLIGVCILPAEMFADFGVNSSDKCQPVKENTYGICGGMRITSRNSRSKLLSTALSIENYEWDNQDLVDNPIRQGFHKNCDGTEYFGNEYRKKRNMSLPIAISGCYASNARIIQPRGTFLTFGSSRFVNEGIGLLLIENLNRTITGVGGVLHNYAYHSAFMVVGQPNAEDHSSSAAVIEYSDSDHIRRVLYSYNHTNRRNIRVQAKGALYSYEVGCRVSSLPSKVFADAIFGYRNAQLSRSSKRKAVPKVNITIDGHTIWLPRPFNASDVTRASIVAKITEPVSCFGETFQYTECGTFDFPMGYPLLIVFSVLIIVYCVLTYLSNNVGNLTGMPMSETAWTAFALQKCRHETITCVIGSPLFQKKYAKYGMSEYMGEFVKVKGQKVFKLRLVSFTKPEQKPRFNERTALTQWDV